MGLEFYDNVRQGDVLVAIFDQGFWFALILGLLSLFLPPLASIGGWWAKIGAVGLVLTQETSEKHLDEVGLRLGEPVQPLRDFRRRPLLPRLLALGLSTGVIANVINMLTKMALDFPYGLGYIVMVVILVGGHLFNLFIGAMGLRAYQPSAVHRVFRQVFEGGGKLFSPL